MNSIELYEHSQHTDSGIRFIAIGTNSYFPLHWHEHLEVHFMLRGKAQIRCGSKLISFEDNDCIIVNSNELHEGIPGTEYQCFKFKLHPSFFDNKYFIFNNIIHDDTVTDLMKKIVKLYEKTDDTSIFLVRSYMYKFASHLCENYVDKSFNLQKNNKEQLEKMNTIASYMHQNYASEITTDALVKMSHYNYSHFCHCFKEVFGVSANKYLLSIRLNKASSLLLTTDFNITEIASLSGFTDPNYFARIFKKEKGMSPTEFRKLNIQ